VLAPKIRAEAIVRYAALTSYAEAKCRLGALPSVFIGSSLSVLLMWLPLLTAPRLLLFLLLFLVPLGLLLFLFRLLLLLFLLSLLLTLCLPLLFFLFRRFRLLLLRMLLLTLRLLALFRLGWLLLGFAFLLLFRLGLLLLRLGLLLLFRRLGVLFVWLLRVGRRNRSEKKNQNAGADKSCCFHECCLR